MYVKAYMGFANEQARYFPSVTFSALNAQQMMIHPRTASEILSTVQETLSDQNLSSVTIVGHSLGGALALLDGVYINPRA
jgi:pimeloyl-ACP methyl ester carboxylesterase